MWIFSSVRPTGSEYQSFRGVIDQFKIKNRKKCLNFDLADCGISQI